MRLVPIGNDWPDDPDFHDLFKQELAQEIEAAIHRRVQLMSPGRSPKSITENYRVRVTGDGFLEVHEVDPAKDVLSGVPPARHSVSPPRKEASTTKGHHEDPILVGVREALEKVPSVALRVKAQIQNRNPLKFQGAPPPALDDLLAS